MQLQPIHYNYKLNRYDCYSTNISTMRLKLPPSNKDLLNYNEDKNNWNKIFLSLLFLLTKTKYRI